MAARQQNQDGRETICMVGSLLRSL